MEPPIRESPTDPGNEVQRGQEWVQSRLHDAIGGIASVYESSCAGDVPLGNAPNVERSWGESTLK